MEDAAVVQLRDQKGGDWFDIFFLTGNDIISLSYKLLCSVWKYIMRGGFGEMTPLADGLEYAHTQLTQSEYKRRSAVDSQLFQMSSRECYQRSSLTSIKTVYRRSQPTLQLLRCSSVFIKL